MADLEKYYRDKRVFLTGHTGFKGSWMLKWLHDLGAIVKGYSLKPQYNEDLYHVIGGDTICNSTIEDIRNLEKLSKEIEEFRPDFVFHLAAQPLVRVSYELPIDTFDINVMGTANVLEAVRTLNYPCVTVLITTDKVYENKEWHYPYRESDRLGGYDPYSASKAAAEIVIQSFRDSYFNVKNYEIHKKSIASARAGNVIGGGDWSKFRIIPDVIKSLQNEEVINVRNPYAIRPWQHVLEPIGGYLLLGAKMAENPTKYCSSWNFGPHIEDTFTVEEIVKKSIDIWGKGEYQIQSNVNAPHEAGLLKLDINKSINELGWKPKLGSEKAIKWTIDFYKEVDKLNCMEKQIKEYQILG